MPDEARGLLLLRAAEMAQAMLDHNVAGYYCHGCGARPMEPRRPFEGHRIGCPVRQFYACWIDNFPEYRD